MKKDLLPYFLITIGDVGIIIMVYLNGLNSTSLARIIWATVLTVGAIILTILIHIKQEKPTS